MSAQDVAKYWREGADDALATAQALMDAKRYHHALFFCHLALEKNVEGKNSDRDQRATAAHT